MARGVLRQSGDSTGAHRLNSGPTSTEKCSLEKLIAELNAAPLLRRANSRRFGVDMTPYPPIRRVGERLATPRYSNWPPQAIHLKQRRCGCTSPHTLESWLIGLHVRARSNPLIPK